MAQLNSELIINGVNIFQAYGYKSVLITSDATRLFGAQRSIEVDSMSNGTLSSYKITKNRPKITIELIKMKENSRTPGMITHKDLGDLSRLLFKNNICIIQERNAVYYGWLTNGSNWFNSANQGYFVLEFELASPYCYSPIQTESFYVNKTKSFTLRNVATADEPVYARIKIIGRGNGHVKITNHSDNNVITVKNVKKDEEIIIEGETREIYSITDSNENMVKRLEYTKDYLILKYAENNLTVEGECLIEIMFQCPMIIV